MRRLISLILMGALSTALLAKADFSGKSVKIKDNLLPLNHEVVSTNLNKNTERYEDSGEYARGYNGAAWEFNMRNNKIAYNPVSAIIATAQQRFDVANPGGMDVSFGSWGDLQTKEVFGPASGTIGMDNPAVAMMDQYIFVAFTNIISESETRPYMLVYNTEEQDVSDVFEIQGENENLGDDYPGIRWPHIDVTKNPDTGEYVVMTTWFAPLQGYDNTKSFVVVGKSADPYEGDWTFSDYSDLEITMDNTASTNPRQQVDPLKPFWGADGKGLAITCVIDRDYTDPNWQSEYPNAEAYLYRSLGYITTNDYGETWNLRDGDKYYAQSLNAENMSLYYGMTKTIVDEQTGQETVHNIDRSSMYWNIDATITSQNELYVYAMVLSLNEEGSTYYWLDGGTPGVGYLAFNATLTNDGLEWKGSSFVSSESGLISALLDTGDGWAKYSNGLTLSMGKMEATNGNMALYAAHVDRPYGAEAVENPFSDGYTKFYGDIYLSTSTDGKVWSGKNWGPEIFGDEFNPEEDPAFPSSFMITTDHDVNKFAAEVAPLGSWNGEYGDAAELTIVAAYQTHDEENPNEGTDETKFQQEYHLVKIDQQDVPMLLGVSENPELMVEDFELDQNYPNPFNPTTSIKFAVKSAADVKLSVYNVLGEEVANLVNGRVNAGVHSVEFNAANFNSGVYFYKLNVDGNSLTKKMVLAK